MDRLEWLRVSSQLSHDKIPFVVVTLVDVKISAPAEPGARAIFTRDGLFCGTVGGGKIEAKAAELAASLLSLSQDTSQFIHLNLKKDIGMTCGGEISLFLESHHVGRWHIAVFGAGHVAQALVPVLDTFDCEVTVVDQRREWLDKFKKAPNRRLLCRKEPSLEVGRLPQECFFLCITQGHATDLPIATAILKRGMPRFLGIIGSRSKAITLKRELLKNGVEKGRVESIHCPVGVGVGGRKPPEIAVSIAAQLLQERDAFCSLNKETIS